MSATDQLREALERILAGYVAGAPWPAEAAAGIARVAREALAAAVDADPRLAAFLKLAALTDEELRQRVEDALVKHAHESRRPKAVAILAALGLPVVEQHNHDASGIYSDCPACRTVLAKQEPTGGER